MSDYTLTQAEFKRLKTRLTTKQNKLAAALQAQQGKTETRASREAVCAAAKQVMAEADYANAIFAAKGAPDDWARWERAKDDATFAFQRNNLNAFW